LCKAAALQFDHRFSILADNVAGTRRTPGHRLSIGVRRALQACPVRQAEVTSSRPNGRITDQWHIEDDLTRCSKIGIAVVKK